MEEPGKKTAILESLRTQLQAMKMGGLVPHPSLSEKITEQLFEKESNSRTVVLYSAGATGKMDQAEAVEITNADIL